MGTVKELKLHNNSSKNANFSVQCNNFRQLVSSIIIIHEKNDFTTVSKNLARYRVENNFVRPSK